MRNKIGRSVVPIDAIRPLMEEWMSRQETDVAYGSENRNDGMLFRDTPVQKLARETGLPVRKITGILRGTLLGQKNIDFDTADKLLCGMQMNAEWHIRLAEFYDDIDVASYERHLCVERAA